MAELRTVTITERFTIDDVLTDLDDVPTFSNLAGTLGIWRVSDAEEIAAATTALTKTATGTYTYSFTESPNNYTYGYWIKWVYDGNTEYAEHTKRGSSAAITTRAKYKAYAGITATTDDSLIDDLVNRATNAIEQYCDVNFTYDTYRERYDGDGSTDLLLKQFPIGEIKLLSTGLTDAIRITNTSSDAYHAYIRVTPTTMVLNIQGGANDGSDSLTLTDYTLTTLVTAINALGKSWAATLQLSTYGVWNAEEILECSGVECRDNYGYVQCPYEPETDFKIYEKQGRVHLPVGFSSGHQNVTVRYAAGYSVMPDDLIQICLDLVNVYYKSRKTDSTVRAEKLGDHSIAYAAEGGGGARDIPQHIRRRLAPYKKHREAV